jgi:hydroxyethylthiazole kinase-like sugar kinase family protein
MIPGTHEDGVARNDRRRERDTTPLIAGIATGCGVGAIVALFYGLPWAAAVSALAAAALLGLGYRRHAGGR